MDALAVWIVANPEGATLVAGMIAALVVQLLKKLAPKWFPPGMAKLEKVLAAAVLAALASWGKNFIAHQPFSAIDALVTMAASTLAHSALLQSEDSVVSTLKAAISRAKAP